MLAPRTVSLIRGTLKVAFALLAAASFGGWVVVLGMFIGVTVTEGVITAAFWAITVLYTLLAVAVGNATGRRQGERGIAASLFGALLTWAILELFFYLYQIGSPQMRVPMIAGVAFAAAGAAIGSKRRADREALRIELQEELNELKRDEDEPGETPVAVATPEDLAPPDDDKSDE